MKTASVVENSGHCVFYWINVFFKLLFAVSFSDLFITIQYAVFPKLISTFYVSLYIYIFVYIYNNSIYMYIYI